ncbi:MAG: hypothetical protein ACRCSF_10470 [Mycobacteriaceae bacterium]
MIIDQRCYWAAVALGVVVFVLACASCTLRVGDDELSTFVPQPYSHLSEEGIKQIKQSGQARFDLRDGTLSLAEVGLPVGGFLPLIGGAGSGEKTLILDAPERQEVITTETMVFTDDVYKQNVAYIKFWRFFEDPLVAFAELRQGIQRWALKPKSVELWIAESTKSGKEKKEERSISGSIGPAGLLAGVTATSKNGHVTLEYTIYLDPEYFSPEELEQLARMRQ